MKRIFFASWFALLMFISGVPAQNPADRVTSDDTLTLLVRVRSRHIDYFEACVPIRLNEPFTIVWGSEKVKEIVSGTVGASVAGDYPTTLKISEGNGQCRTETAPKLKIDEPLEWSNVASSLFNHIDTYRFVLSKKACDVGDPPNK
jgi:hypothetical protein